MVLDEVGILIASVISGLTGGFLSSWMSFNASGEAFDPRKHGNALITGALSGMGAGLAAVAAFPTNPSSAQIAFALIATFLGTAGVDMFRSKLSKMVTKQNTTTTTTKEVEKVG